MCLESPISKTLLMCSLILLAGCSEKNIAAQNLAHETRYLVPLKTLGVELRNPDYLWNGPCSQEDRIPVLHAARALAYWGDSAVPILLDTIDDSEVDINSVYDALSEIGIPVHEYQSEIMNRQSKGVRKWWADNQESTVGTRNEHRANIGLPSVDPGK